MLSGDTAALRIGLRWKFIVALALQTVIIAALIIGIEQWSVHRSIRQQTIAQGEAIARTVGFGLTDDERKIVAHLRANPSVEYTDFIASDGRVLASRAPSPTIV